MPARAPHHLAHAVLGLLACAGCTGILGIDGEYVTDTTLSANGEGNVDGGTEGGGGGGAGGGDAAGCGVGCPRGQKCCGDVCVAATPSNGCSSSECSACPAPDGATPSCTNGACDFQCRSGFEKSGAACVPSTSTSDSGGPPPVCVVSTCPACIAQGTQIYKACCRDDGTCGCAFPFAPCGPPL